MDFGYILKWVVFEKIVMVEDIFKMFVGKINKKVIWEELVD